MESQSQFPETESTFPENGFAFWKSMMKAGK
jgi:hypothetical protein